MKKFIAFFAVVFITLGLFLYKDSSGKFLFSHSYCSSPVTYKVGSVDSRFSLTRDEVVSDLAQAASIWNESVQKPVFAYATSGKVTVNLAYDLRQKLSTQLDQLEQEVDTNKNTLSPQIEDYQARSNVFDKKITQLNSDIRYWNTQGGAPPEEYNLLKERQAALQAEEKELTALAQSLQQSTQSYNGQIRELNQTAGQLRRTLTIRPEEGIYDGETNTITIYFNNSKDELIHTLAHELGHSRGLGHNENSQAIMYKSSSEVITPTTDDIAALSEICKDRSYPQIIAERYFDLLLAIRSRLIK